MGWPQLNYLGRTAPRHFLIPLLEWYDGRYREAFENLFGGKLTNAQWLQAMLPSTAGGLGFTSEQIPLGNQAFGRADLAFVVACRAVAPLVEALVPARPGYSRLGWAPAIQRLAQIFPNWQSELENPDIKPKQKELMDVLMLSFRKGLDDIFSDQHKRVLRAFAAPWADGWVRAIPSHAFDTCLSNVAFHDILSMRLGRQVFEGDMACPRCPQSQDSFGHHTLACHMFGGKTVLHNMIRDEIYRTLQGGKLQCKLEPNHLLPDLPAQRPADILIIPTALCRQSVWGLMPKIALDISIVSPFRSSDLGRESLSAAKARAENKRRDRATAQRCHAQGVGFEPLVFEHSGGLEPEGDRLLTSLCRAADDNLQRNPGSTGQLLRQRISFILQQHGHICLQRARDGSKGSQSTWDRSFQFLQIYSET